jgi:predicted amidophosphoribosyltransferase
MTVKIVGRINLPYHTNGKSYCPRCHKALANYNHKFCERCSKARYYEISNSWYSRESYKPKTSTT